MPAVSAFERADSRANHQSKKKINSSEDGEYASGSG